jgi:predicted nucleic acid-binding protein
MLYDARDGCPFIGRSLVLDTNVWISIYGGDVRGDRAVYSDFYGDAMRKANSIVVNDLIIAEFFHRFCRIEYQIMFPKGYPGGLKPARHREPDFKARVGVVRDICLEIIRASKFERVELDEDEVERHLRSASTGALDYNDCIILSQCARHGYVMVTHDGDFASQPVDLVTANRTVLGYSSPYYNR